MRRQVCSVGAADAKCLLTVLPNHAFQRNATAAPCHTSQRNAKHISRIRQLSHSSGMHLCRRQRSRHFARTSLSLRPCCIPAYTYFITNGIMSHIAFAANAANENAFSALSACHTVFAQFGAFATHKNCLRLSLLSLITTHSKELYPVASIVVNRLAQRNCLRVPSVAVW